MKTRLWRREVQHVQWIVRLFTNITMLQLMKHLKGEKNSLKQFWKLWIRKITCCNTFIIIPHCLIFIHVKLNMMSIFIKVYWFKYFNFTQTVAKHFLNHSKSAPGRIMSSERTHTHTHTHTQQLAGNLLSHFDQTSTRKTYIFDCFETQICLTSSRKTKYWLLFLIEKWK